MPDLLGATNPVPGYDKSVTTRNVNVQPQPNTQLHNVPDLTRVTRADQRTEQQGADLKGNNNIRYDSNFQSFIQRLMKSPSLAECLTTIFSGREGTVVVSGLREGIATDMAQILQMLQMDEKQLGEFLLGQVKEGSIFNGSFCAILRRAFAQADSQSAKEEILQFLKSYSDHLSTAHIIRNIERNMNQMARAIPASWSGKLQEMMGLLENGLASGDRYSVLQLMQKGIFPYMARYVEQTHDMGTPRQLLSQLALDVVRYENGAEEKVLEYFHQLKGYGALRKQLSILDDEMLMTLLKGSGNQGNTAAAQFSRALTEAASKALNGEGNQQVQEGFKNLMAAMLVNESVYMPLNHYVVPLKWNGKMLFSELWVDPDSERQNGEASPDPKGNTCKMLIKVDVQSLGLFDVVVVSQRENVDVQIACPEKVAPFSRQVEDTVAHILRRNELNPLRVAVNKMERPANITDIFPKIFQGRNSVNVKA